MKYVKERNFVKKIFDEHQIELKKSTIEIIESCEKNGGLLWVTFKDRFGKEYEVSVSGGKTKIKELT